MNRKCQIFTPENYVVTLLDSIKYIDNLYGKKILENSCGDGNILIVIVKRYISSCKKNRLTCKQIEHGLERDIYGVEIDRIHISTCINKLNKLLIEENLEKVNWNLYCTDYLKKKFCIKFDYIVSNPPYISYSELNLIEQNFVRGKFSTCKNGKFDYCYAFIEKSIGELTEKGEMSFLIPSSIFKTVFGFSLRELLITKLNKIIDYQSMKIFDNALVSSSIFVFDNKVSNTKIKYINYSTKENLYIMKNRLYRKRKWIFSEFDNVGKLKFGDYFAVKHSVATLYNDAYIIKNWTNNKFGIKTNGIVIENAIVKNGYAPKNINKEIINKIIFPYDYSGNQLIRFKEKEFENNFPGATKYLLQYENILAKRRKDKNSKWFEYGRSQALNYLNQEKLITSTVISDQVTVKKIGKEDIPYSGIFIYPIKNKTLDEAIKILKSPMFNIYIKKAGIPINSGSVRITTKDILEYCFMED